VNSLNGDSGSRFCIIFRRDSLVLCGFSIILGNYGGGFCSFCSTLGGLGGNTRRGCISGFTLSDSLGQLCGGLGRFGGNTCGIRITGFGFGGQLGGLGGELRSYCSQSVAIGFQGVMLGRKLPGFNGYILVIFRPFLRLIAPGFYLRFQGFQGGQNVVKGFFS
jgi:hypothetical protein